MLTLEETILNGRDWVCIVLNDYTAAHAVDRKYELVDAGLLADVDFIWGFRASEYDGFTVNRPAHAVFAFSDPAVASFFRLKWL